MLRRAGALCLGLWLFLFPLAAHALAAAAEAESAVSRRALYVACDFFLSQEDTWPSSSNNVKAVAEAFSGGNMDFEVQRILNGSINSVAGLAQAVQDAFSQADENDVSYFYISTHGLYDSTQSNLEAGLLLCDGMQEEVVTARQLSEIFAPILGRKVLIIDACNSGAFIGKGVSGGVTETAFSGPEYKVLTSAGGSEESWYWSSTDRRPGAVQGAGYFSSVLCDALGYHGEYGADQNRDGSITLSECYRYLMENHAASTPQVYPQEDDFVLFNYDNLKAAGGESAISGITFFDTVLDAAQSAVSFEFTATRPVQMAYQLVYYQEGKWQFATAPLLFDDQEQGGDFGDQKGFISPGRKQRTLNLAPQEADAYGYVMVQLITIEDGKTTLHGSRVLCVPPAAGDPELSVKTAMAFTPSQGKEMSILVSHRIPCRLSISILDASGHVVRRLSVQAPSRPQQLTPSGSAFYWNGKTQSGDAAAPGMYTARVTVQLGGSVFEAHSEPFELLAE